MSDRFSAKAPSINYAEDRKQQAADDGRLPPKVPGCPEEVDTVEEADKQRRVAKRTEGAADIGDQNDEKDHHMRIVWPRNIRADQRPNQDHRRACGADDARHHRAEPEDDSVVPGRAPDVTADENAARHGIKREQKNDEAEILRQHGVNEHRRHRRAASEPSERGQRQYRPGGRDLPVMRVPHLWKQQRSKRDRQQQTRKGQHKGPRQRSAVEGCSPRILRHDEQHRRSEHPSTRLHRDQGTNTRKTNTANTTICTSPNRMLVRPVPKVSMLTINVSAKSTMP